MLYRFLKELTDSKEAAWEKTRNLWGISAVNINKFRLLGVLSLDKIDFKVRILRNLFLAFLWSLHQAKCEFKARHAEMLALETT